MDARRDRPRIVLVTGDPGSGKSTLGAELSRALRVPFLARDDVRGGLFLTSGAWSAQPRRVPPGSEAVEAFLRLVETAAGLGVSCVVEYVVRHRRPEDLARITAVADCLVVRTHCRNALERFARRRAGDRLMNRQPVLDALGHATIDDHVEGATDLMRQVPAAAQVHFDLPVLEVATDDGYDPGIDEIVAFITAGT